MTTVFDAAGEGSAKACWVLMRRAKRTSLSPQALPRNLRGCSRLPVTAPKNRTRIGPHLGRRKVSLFSPKSGYVRRSEISDSGRVALRAREVFCQTIAELVSGLHENDRNRLGQLLRRSCCLRGTGDDYIR